MRRFFLLMTMLVTFTSCIFDERLEARKKDGEEQPTSANTKNAAKMRLE